jgi:hypothetical protein
LLTILAIDDSRDSVKPIIISPTSSNILLISLDLSSCIAFLPLWWTLTYRWESCSSRWASYWLTLVEFEPFLPMVVPLS